MPIPKVQVIKNSAPMPEFSRTFMQTLRNESNDTEKHEKFIKTQYHLNSLERTFLFANAVMTLSSKVIKRSVMTLLSKDRAQSFSIDNMANEDSLLSVIDVLLKVLISFNLLKLLSTLATVTGQVSKIRSAMYTFGYNSNK